MVTKVCCPNCGNQNLFLSVTETVEAIYRISSDGAWKSTPVADAYGKWSINHASKILQRNMTLFCQYCGQENEALFDNADPLHTCVAVGHEITHGDPHAVTYAHNSRCLKRCCLSTFRSISKK